MEFEFKMRKRKYRATRERVIEALREVAPEPATPYMVAIEGTAYPLRQAFGETFGVSRKLMGTVSVVRIFERMGFEVTKGGMMEIRPWPRAPEVPKPPVWRPQWRQSRHREELWVEEIELPTVVLRWSYFERWEDVATGMADGERIDTPPDEPGVYEVAGDSRDGSRLYIGRAADLKSRVCYALIVEKPPHPAGQKIRENEDLAQLSIRWAVTDRPAAVEEELHRRHIETYGRWPKYTMRT